MDAGGIEVRGLTVAYRQKPVLRDVSLTIPAGVTLAVVGPNGAGKTTLLKALLGLIRPSAGTIAFPSSAIVKGRPNVAYVPQRGSVDWDFPTTVRDVVRMGTYGRVGWFRGIGTNERKIADDAIERVGLTPYADRQIRRLSGGQQQRVFLARALVQQAPFSFLDEPFQGIDALTERTLVGLFREFRDMGRTVVAVHHDLATVESYFDRTILLNERIFAEGTPADVLTPERIQAAYRPTGTDA